MARKSTGRASTENRQEKHDPPKTLENHPFFGLKLDEEQKIFRDAIWSPDYDIVFCKAKSGTGKTTIAVSTAMLLCEYGRYSRIVYQAQAGVHEYKQGLLPGSLEEKSAPLFAPLYQAVARLNYDPQRVIASDYNMIAQKECTPMITAQTDSYIRGISIGEVDEPVVVIVDEFQNATVDALKTILSRVNVGSKVVCIGCDFQCDLKDKRLSGINRAYEVYGKNPRAKFCELTTCYRSWIAEYADLL